MATDEIKVIITDELLEPLIREKIGGVTFIYGPRETVSLPEIYSLKSDGLVGKDIVELMTILIPAVLILKPMMEAFLKKIGEDLANLVEKGFRLLMTKNDRLKNTEASLVKIIYTGESTTVIIDIKVDNPKIQSYLNSIQDWCPSLTRSVYIICRDNQSSSQKLCVKEINIDDIIIGLTQKEKNKS